MKGLLSDDFLEFSTRIGSDPLQIQGPGGNTSIKADNVMWIKASGKELADASNEQIFVAVDLCVARSEAFGAGNGKGSCVDAILDRDVSLRPSIETTFHAALDWSIVAHSHSVATIAHAISPEGRAAARDKLGGIDPVFIPYRKPGLSLARAILDRINADTRVIVLENHGLICCGATVEETEALMSDVENRLAMEPRPVERTDPGSAPEAGYEWAINESWLAQDADVEELVTSGSYYPDHVVFLGPGIPREPDFEFPSFISRGIGVQIKTAATRSQRAMLRCVSDVFRRQQPDWSPQPIGAEAEAELLDWDAEKYRQSLARRQ